MEDLDAVDYSEDPLEGVSIWCSSFSSSTGMYDTDLTENYPSYSPGELSRSYPVVLPDVPPTWPALSTPPHSPTTLGFVSDCLNPNPGLDPSATGAFNGRFFPHCFPLSRPVIHHRSLTPLRLEASPWFLRSSVPPCH